MTDSEDYPESCLRGIRSPKWVMDGIVLADAFEPDKRTAEGGADNCGEVSINWEDDEGALTQLLGQSEYRDNGAARLDTEHLEYAKNSNVGRGCFDYERNPTVGEQDSADNTYHGNLLYSMESSVRVHRMVMSTLALNARLVVE